MLERKLTIGWIKVTSKKNGGEVYNQLARDALSKEFNLDLINSESKHFQEIRYLKIPELLFNLSKLKGKKDLWIRDFYSTITLPLDRTQGKNLALVHQVDFSVHPLISRPFFFFLERVFYQNLKKIDAIVVVSDFWRNYFLKRGHSNVYKIYNSFNLVDFKITNQEITEFKRKFNLEGKPILYLGNCQKIKGVVESYQSLKDLDVYLVTSGEPLVKIPAMNLNLEYKDYLRLLKASSIVITMSKFKEGWCRTAHEAMLCKTPVIGSGKSGMKELLVGGKQIICKDFSNLKEKTEYLLSNPGIRKEMGEKGYDYAKDFTLEKFEKEWIKLIKKLCAE